jgi:cation:H+ antiporter
MTRPLLELLAGVLLAWWGGEWFVRALVSGAKWARIPAGLVGLTLAAFATSAPELAVGVQSAAAGMPQLSLGDTLGSNVANVALFLAIGLMISADRVPSTTARRDYWAALLTPVLVALLGMDGFLSRTDAAVLMMGFFGWLGLVTHSAVRHAGTGARVGSLSWKQCATGIAGLLLLFLAGHFIVTSCRAIAMSLAVDPFIIGTVVVAVATGTPELATTIVAKLRGHHDLGLGNIYGSNIFNAWFILPVAALIHPIRIASPAEMMVALGAGVITTVSTHTSKGILGRDRGLLLLAQYGGFVALMWYLGRTPNE